MQLRVLGPLELVDDDAVTVPLRGAQLRRALATLAVHAPSPTPVDVLNDVLWPDGPPSANALQAAMSKLRKAIAPIAIEATASAYQLALGPAQLDAERFETLVTAGREAAADGRHADAIAHLDTALALWRGRPFDDVADLPIGQPPAARLLSMRDAAMTTRLESNIARGAIEAAADELEALVVAEPFVERWWALLMIARYRQDRQADALRAFQRARTVLGDELGLEPGPELRDLEAKILQHHPSLGPTTRATFAQPVRPRQTTGPASALPPRLMSFIGRDRHVEALCSLLGTERVVTIAGTGGAGKTTLAMEVARRMSAAEPARRVVLIELASVPRGGDVIAAIASVIAPSDGDLRSAGSPLNDIDRIIDALGTGPTLLVLDNCEHLIADAAAFVNAVLRHSPHLSVLATSREPLAVAGEWVWPIPPLSNDDSVQLLRDRAAAAGVELDATADSHETAVRLVHRLDGLPLAIELAAARLRSMSLADIVERIDDRFALLSAGPRSAEPRQQALRNLVDWSYDLLDDRERTLFRRLAVFSGGASLEAVEQVCVDPLSGEIDRLARTDVDALLARLVDKSLVIADRTANGVRYRMLQTLNDYATDQLIASGEAEQVAHRHSRYFAERVAPVERGLYGHQQRDLIAWLRLEWGNITTAIDHALAVDDGDLAVRLTAPLGWYFFMIDETAAGAEWLHAALACSGRPEPRLKSLALAHYAFLASTGADPAGAALVAEHALATLDTYDDAKTEATVIGMYVMCQLFRGRLDACREYFPLCEAAAHRSGDRWTIAMASIVKGELSSAAGDPVAAERDMAHAADGFAAVGDRFAYTLCVTHAAELAELRGDYDRAVRLLEETLSVADDVGFSVRGMAGRSRLANLEILRGNLSLAASLHQQALDTSAGPIPQWVSAISLMGLANIARRRGQPQEALRHVDEALSLPRSIGIPMMRTSLLVARGYSLDLAGDAEGALAAQTEALEVARQLGTARVLANAMEGLAGALALAAEHGDEAQASAAAQLLGAADALRRGSGGSMPAAERFDVDRATGRARKLLGDQAFEVSFVAGALDPDGAWSALGQRALSV